MSRKELLDYREWCYEMENLFQRTGKYALAMVYSETATEVNKKLSRREYDYE